MITKGFDCNRCNKKIVCKYTELMNKFYENNLNTYEQYTTNHDSDTYIPIVALKLNCLEYIQNGLPSR